MVWKPFQVCKSLSKTTTGFSLSAVLLFLVQKPNSSCYPSRCHLDFLALFFLLLCPDYTWGNVQIIRMGCKNTTDRAPSPTIIPFPDWNQAHQPSLFSSEMPSICLPQNAIYFAWKGLLTFSG